MLKKIWGNIVFRLLVRLTVFTVAVAIGSPVGRAAEKVVTPTVTTPTVTTPNVTTPNVVVEQLKTDLQARETPRGTAITLPGDVLFDFDKWNIRSDAEATLMKVGQLIAETKPRTVLVEGHTDAKGDDDYNFRLSDRRAEAVKQFLLKGTELTRDAIATKGLGETKPVASNSSSSGTDDAEGRQRNRRVEIYLK